MTDNQILEPISAQIRYWIKYYENKPNKFIDAEAYQKFKSVYEMDCNLTGGNMNADMIFSMFIPFRRVLTRLSKSMLKVERTATFFKTILTSLSVYLPPKNPLVQELSALMSIGRTRANIMILPPSDMNSLRGNDPYWDYVPYFLHECFHTGAFSERFSSDKQLKEWIKEEHLDIIFNGPIERDNIKDLVGSGSVKNNLTPGPNLSLMLINYTKILQLRSEFYLNN